ncbi:MAG: hypothetical protein K6E68_09500 [Lachnospiraceae bacterium]|nr:hypothetical protein [Lachnospiraceae bacterium]
MIDLKKEKAGVIRMHVLDYNEELHTQTLLEQGISQGISQGITQGMQEKTIKVIRNMLLRGQTDEDIMSIAECSLEDIEKVRKEI